ncbi:cellulase family glycosylhydrolase [Parapedobacter sp. 10938]|uniref:cellulase family glycosylhydrolase n=1 Tax=Parapedobacter flavus TaxID=3110225 RepID=UPI002DBF4519|nr:cellulase family glycosylhydrolase [Parapedobacter sp. 10938]MEC3879146.1 cellulase family glycosylhydrolase [Parapedobacter sp. 10938]
MKMNPLCTKLMGAAMLLVLGGMSSCEQMMIAENTQKEQQSPLMAGQELFYSDYPHAFVSSDTGEPVLINGVNIKRGPHRKVGGAWETSYVNEEITALGASGSPTFNAIRIAMDWPYFNTAPGVFDAASFAQLDLLIDNAISQGLYVILDPIHVRGPGGACNEDPVMAGARWNIPAWAWSAVGAPANPSGSCGDTNETSDLMDNVLALQATADYLKYVLTRYHASTARGKQVIAVDLVNEPRADGATAQARFNKIMAVYADWLAPTGTKSLRSANPDKILIAAALHGDISLAGMNLSVLQQSNIVFTFHDYFGRALSTSPMYGLGYSASGYASQQEHMYSATPTPYDPSTLSYAARKAEHRAYLQQYLDWLGAYQLPLYIGEYGILNPCHGGDALFSPQYARDTYDLYDNLYVVHNGESVPLKMPRTWWTNGYWDDMALWYRSGTCGSVGSKTYFPYAKDVTGELNLVSNPGFEDDFAGWTVSGDVAVEDVLVNSANVRSGARSVRAWNSTAYTGSVRSASAYPAAGTYTAQVWSRGGGTFGTRQLQVYVNNVLAGQVSIPTSSNWTVHEVSGITIPSGAAIQVGIALNAAAGAWTQFDDFSLRKD